MRTASSTTLSTSSSSLAKIETGIVAARAASSPSPARSSVKEDARLPGYSSIFASSTSITGMSSWTG